LVGAADDPFDKDWNIHIRYLFKLEEKNIRMRMKGCQNGNYWALLECMIFYDYYAHVYGLLYRNNTPITSTNIAK